MWLMVEELDGRIASGSPIGFLENSGKTSNTVSHFKLPFQICSLVDLNVEPLTILDEFNK